MADTPAKKDLTGKLIGVNYTTPDLVAKVTGKALYSADVPLENALWGKLLHSPHAHARIVSIYTSAAKALPGVRAVITGADAGTGFRQPVAAFKYLRRNPAPGQR